MAASATSTGPVSTYPRIPSSPSPSPSPLSSPPISRSSAYRRSSSISSTTSATSPSPFPHATPTTSQYSPSKPKPPPLHNAHPYAIKTTSTALLTRSTSSTTMSDAAVNHYIPPSSPSPSPSPSSPSGSGFAYGFSYGSGAEGDERDGSPTAKRRGHRYSRSLTSDLPMPLPPPPGSAQVKGLSSIGPSYSTPGFESPYKQTRQPLSPSPSPSGSRGRNRPRHSLSEGEAEQEDDDDTPRRRLYYQQQQQQQFSRVAAPAFSGVHQPNGSLPDDPKAWTPAQLAQYLLTTSSADLHVTDTIAKFVKEKQISGRAFLRLAEADLDSLSTATRAALLTTSRSLRQNLVRARILSSTSDSKPLQHPLPLSANAYSSSGSPLDGEHEPGSGTTSGAGAVDNDHANAGFNPDFRFGGATSSTSTSPIIPIGTLSRSRGVRPRRRDGANGSRGSMDSLSGASDSGSSATSSSSHSNSHSHTRTRTLSAARDISASAKKRVKERVDELEERISVGAGSGVEEEGSASSSSSGIGRERSGSPVKRAQAAPASADGAKAKAKALPQRGGVVNLFEEGQRRGHDEPVKQRQPQDEEDKDSTIVGLARKNVNGREPRLLPFPPAPPPPHAHHHSHQHIQAQHSHTPMSSAGGVEDYEFGFRRTYGASSGNGHVNGHGAHSNGALEDPFGSVYVVRHSPRPASVAHQATGAGSHVSAGGSPARAASAAASSVAGGGSGGRPSRLLPFPPVVGHAVLHHPVPKRAVGVGVDSATSDTGNEVWESALEDQEWAHEVVHHQIGMLENAKGALDQQIETENGKKKEELGDKIKRQKGSINETQTGSTEADEEEEMSVEQLLLRGDTGVPKVSGVEAWEMELGETVKRIGANANASTSANGKDVEIGRKAGGGSKRHSHTGRPEMKTKGRAELTGSQSQRGGLMALFADDPEGEGLASVSVSSIAEKPSKEADAENKARSEAEHKQREEKTAELNARETALDEREREVRERLASVDERERQVIIREEAVGKREVDIGKREDSAGKREEGLIEREATIQTREDGVEKREGELEVLENRARERETRVGAREVEADSVWRDFEKRERDLKECEINLQEKLMEVEKREKELKEREGVLRSGKEDLEKREGEVTQREIAALEREEKEVRPTTKEKLIQAVQENCDKCIETVSEAQQIHSAARPKPYVVSSWLLKRDYFLGRFIGVFAGLGDNYTAERGGGMLASIRGGGGALVLMGIGMCAVVLRVLGRRVAGVAGART